MPRRRNGRMPFSRVPHEIVLQLAKQLDPASEADWRVLAEVLGCPPDHAPWIWSRLPAAPLGSPTLMLFSEIEGCIRRQLFVSDVIEALRHIRNDACVTILQPFADKPFKRVFVTCTFDNSTYTPHIMALVNYLLPQQQFKVGIDGTDSLDKAMERFKKADYVLVLISPLYHQVVTGNPPSSASSNHHTLHAFHIYQRMLQESATPERPGAAAAAPTPSYFIPVLMPGATDAHVPTALFDSPDQLLRWPADQLKIVERMS